uniref:hypothetical protein n=1 Tax=Altererythrobacter segetis TaxID=1104773 RepID=UPI00140E411B|nr:hypothetical protein [Altererythrobacter segetis]
MTGIEISGAVGGLKAAFDLVQGLHSTAKSAAINQVQIELGKHIFDAQTALTALSAAQADAADRIRQLEQQIVNLENWETEKKRYELAEAGQGSVAYRLKSGMEDGQPAHWICPQCYEDGQKSILKHEHLTVGRCEILACNRCGLELVTSGRRLEPPRTAGSFGRGR